MHKSKCIYLHGSGDSFTIASIWGMDDRGNRDLIVSRWSKEMREFAGKAELGAKLYERRSLFHAMGAKLEKTICYKAIKCKLNDGRAFECGAAMVFRAR